MKKIVSRRFTLSTSSLSRGSTVSIVVAVVVTIIAQQRWRAGRDGKEMEKKRERI